MVLLWNSRFPETQNFLKNGLIVFKKKNVWISYVQDKISEKMGLISFFGCTLYVVIIPIFTYKVIVL